LGYNRWSPRRIYCNKGRLFCINQVIDSKDFKEGQELGQDLAGEGLEFLEGRYENYKSNNPDEFQ